MSKTFETTVEIKGAIGSSFTSAFREANQGFSNFKSEARAVQRELDRLGQDFRQGKIHQSQYTEESQKLGRELQSLEREMTDATNAQKRFAQETAAAKKRLDEQALAAKTRNKAFATDIQTGVGNAVGRATSAAAITGIGATAAVAATAIQSVSVAADFEADMSKVQAKTEATKQEMNALKKTALELGASTSLSASETALGMDALAAKGMDANQIIAAMPGIIAGAEASGEDLTMVSDVVTSAINAYGLHASEASRIADVMAMSANKSAAGVYDLGQSFKYAAPISKTLGINLEELSAATGLLVDGGLAGEQAGTSLRMALTRLSDPPTEAAKALKKLNISAIDSKGKFKSLATITEDWNKATKDLTDAQKVQYASTVFGTEASTAMISLFGNGADEIRKMTKALEESEGAAAAASKAMKDNFKGAKEQMTGAMDSAKIAFATPLLPVFQNTMNGITSIIENNMDDIEYMGSTVAQVFSNITAPLSMTEPIQPKIEPHMDPDYVAQAMSKYAADLEKYELVKDMDGSEKVQYMLDESIETIENWVGGSGGEAIQSLMTELGTIAGKAWLNSFGAVAKGAVTELTEGNFAGALTMGAAANAMSGGLLLSGGLAGGKWALGKGKDLITKRGGRNGGENAVSSIPPSSSNVSTVVPTTSNSQNNTAQNRTLRGRRSSFAPSTTTIPDGTYRVNRTASTSRPSIATTQNASIGSRILSGAGKIASKAFLPISAVASIAGIARADNKAEATGSAAGGLAGGVGVAKLGAALGTVLAPGIGTAIGGAVGGLLGSFGGSWLGGKAGNAIASPPPSNNTAVNQAVPIADTATNNTTAINQTLSTLNTNVTALNSYFGTATTETQTNFAALQMETTKLTNNMSILTGYVGQASGWIVSLQGIQPAAQRVISALQSLEQRINAIELPGSTSQRRVAYE